MPLSSKRHGIPPTSERKKTTAWNEFIRSHMDVPVATDFFTTEAECMPLLMLIGERAFCHTLTAYLNRDHREWNHRGKGNRRLFPILAQVDEHEGPVRWRARLGGLLKYHHREAT